MRRPPKGSLALRIAHCPGGVSKIYKRRPRSGKMLRIEVRSAIGRHNIFMRSDTLDLAALRATVELTPDAPLLIPFHPRDVSTWVRPFWEPGVAKAVTELQ